jgi:hypothetical protein
LSDGVVHPAGPTVDPGGPVARHEPALGAIAALAATGIVLEVALLRVLSALLAASWVAPVLGAALLGGGLGAAAVAARPALARRGAAAACAAAAAALAALLPLLWSGAVAAGAPAWALLPTVATFALAGASVAGTFARHRARAAVLYRADLAAAAAAAAGLPALLALAGTGVAAHAAGAGFAFAAVLLAPAAWRAPAAATALPAVLLAVATAVGLTEVDPDRTVAPKPLRALAAAGAVVERSVWDGTARTDLMRAPDGARYVFLDGGAGSLVPGPDPARWRGDVGALAFGVDAGAADGPRRALLIGTGGGLDVAQARAAGVADVTAIEVDAAAVDLVRALGAEAGDVYGAGTRVVVGDGRRELARLAARGEGPWDVITLAQVVLQAAEAQGAARTEQRLYTVEAFRAALTSLTPQGHLALKLYDEATLTRALVTALAALVDAGLAPDAGAAVDHVFVALDGRARPPVPLLVVRRTPFDLEAAVAAARAAEAGGWSLVVVPGLTSPPALADLAAGGLDLDGFAAAAGGDLDVRPTTDARPFFFSFAPGARPGERAAWALGAAALAAIAALALALRASHRAAADRGGGGGAARVVAAGALGTGFLLGELAALEIVRVAVGHPTWSLAAALAAVLLGGAAGAHLVVWRRGRRGAATSVAGAAGLAGLAAAALALVGPAWVALGAPWSPVAAGAAAAALVAAVATAWGLPFPLLLHGAHGPREVAALWAASGLGAVVAAAAAVLMAPTWGLPAIGWSAVAAYGIGVVAVRASSAQAAGAVARASAQASTSSSASGGA